MKLALKDVKVVEYGSLISAPYCGKLLADLGAEVIKVEEPVQGDIARRRPPFHEDIPGTERSGLFLYLNTNKLGVTLSLEKATGREIFQKLIKNSDILIEDTMPGEMAELGLDYSDLKSLNPSLVMTSITPFGQTGPYKDYKGSDLISWHMAGSGYVCPRWGGSAELEPLNVMHLASFLTGIAAAIGTMSALHVQRRTGLGQQVDVSQLEANIIGAGQMATYWPYEHWYASRSSRCTIAPEHFIKCKDGWVCVHASGEQHWRRLVDAMGNPDWANEERFQKDLGRGEHWDSLEALITEWAANYTKAELFKLAKEKRIPLAPVNTMTEVMESQQFKERDFFVDGEHPETGKLTYPGAPYKFSETPCSIRKPAPLLGQHNEDVYCNQLGYTKRELTKMYGAGII